MTNFRIFGLGASKAFAKRVADAIYCDLGAPLEGSLNSHHEERRPDGEAYTTSLDNVRGCDVYVVTSLFGDNTESVDEKLVKACIFINTLRHASAARITLVAPYLCYMRQDRKTESRAPIATQAIAMMLEAVGLDRLLTMDVHNLGAEQNAFRIPIDNLEARKLLAGEIAWHIRCKDRGVANPKKWKVLSPDAGGTARTKQFQYSLAQRIYADVGIVYADKTRLGPEEVRVQIVGDVSENNIIVVDDMIGTGTTIMEVADAVHKAGGKLWAVAATHGLFVNSAPYKLRGIPQIYVTDTIPPLPRLMGQPLLNQIRPVSTANMFAEAIRRIHTEGGSISELRND
jgi:ribose-phosphate pyrophosphokinase